MARLEWMRELRLWLLVSLGAAVAWLILFFWTPDGGVESSLCFIRRVTQIDCPGCGLTRSSAALARGDLLTSFAQHPLGPLLAVQALAVWFLWGMISLRGVDPPPVSLLNWVLTGNGALLVLVWTIRTV